MEPRPSKSGIEIDYKIRLFLVRRNEACYFGPSFFDRSRGRRFPWFTRTVMARRFRWREQSVWQRWPGSRLFGLNSSEQNTWALDLLENALF